MTRSAIAVLIILLVAAPAAAGIINIPADQPTIQAGIDAAVNGDEVVVAPGTYLETINFNGKAITVRSTDPNDVGVVLNTIIDANGAGSCVTCSNGEGQDTVLRGFVITGGSSTNGGGMYNVNSTNPTVMNCAFQGNSASGDGAGMYNHSGCNPTVINCSFSENVASSDGGGMFNQLNSSPTVKNCWFTSNSAATGGGMYNTFNSSPTVINCTFDGNIAPPSFGGGMYNESGNPVISHCSFRGNQAAQGGAMYNTGTSPTVTNTGFRSNAPDAIQGPFTDGGGNSLSYCAPPIPLPDPCPADTNGDGVVDVLDLLNLLGSWGVCPG